MPKRLTDVEKVRRARLKYCEETKSLKMPRIYGQHEYDDGYYMIHRDRVSMVMTDEPMADIQDGGKLEFRLDTIIPKDNEVKEVCFVDLEEFEELYKGKKSKNRAVKNLIKIRDGFLNAKYFLEVAKCVDAEEVCVYRNPNNRLSVYLLEGRYGKALICPINIMEVDDGFNVVMEVA